MIRSLISYNTKKINIELLQNYSYKFLIAKLKKKKLVKKRIAFFNFFSLFASKKTENFFFNYSKALTGSILVILKQKYLSLNQGFSIELLAIGVGYRFEKMNKKINVLILNLGYSHYNYCFLPKSTCFRFHKNYLFLFGTDFLELKNLAVEIRSNRIPEPYKGKGIRYFSEIVEIKEGKKKKN